MLAAIIALVAGGVLREYMGIAVPEEFFSLCILVVSLLYSHLLFTDFRKGEVRTFHFSMGPIRKNKNPISFYFVFVIQVALTCVLAQALVLIMMNRV